MKHLSQQHLLIEQGMKLAANLPDIMPDQASEQIKPIYQDIQQTLRVPIVNLIFRTLANYSDYFVNIWKRLSPIFQSIAYEQIADEIRAKALLDTIPNTQEIDWQKLREMDQIRAFNDTIFYVLPKLLIVSAAFNEATFGEVQQEANQSLRTSDTSQIPLGVAEGTIKVQMVDSSKATGKVKKLFESIKQRHGHPLVSSYYRALGNWPEFLEIVWKRIEPIVGSPAYEDRKQTLNHHVQISIGSLPISKLEKVDLDEEQRTEVQAILAAFRLKFIPEMLLDVALIKAMLDGAEAASTSQFSVARTKRVG